MKKIQLLALTGSGDIKNFGGGANSWGSAPTYYFSNILPKTDENERICTGAGGVALTPPLNMLLKSFNCNIVYGVRLTSCFLFQEILKELGKTTLSIGGIDFFL